MKKIILICSILSYLLVFNAFADGCRSLANSTWKGQVLVSGQPVPVEIVIKEVIHVGGNLFFDLIGTLNGEPIGRVDACSEMEGKIYDIWFESDNHFIRAYEFLPNPVNPTTFKKVGGLINHHYIDVSSNNILNKVQ